MKSQSGVQELLGIDLASSVDGSDIQVFPKCGKVPLMNESKYNLLHIINDVCKRY